MFSAAKLDICYTLIYQVHIWGMYHMLAERQVVVPLWWLVLYLYFKKKNRVVTQDVVLVVEPRIYVWWGQTVAWILNFATKGTCLEIGIYKILH